MVFAIVGSTVSLLWTLLLLLMALYTCGVAFTEVAIFGEDPSADRENSVVSEYFGSLGATILTLYESVTGGLDWAHVVEHLNTEVSMLAGLAFCLFIAFVTFTVFNVVTGVFVEKCVTVVRHEEDAYIYSLVTELFPLDTEVDLRQFELMMDKKEMREYFRTIDVGVSEAPYLFKLLDVDGSGSVDADEMISGCWRLKGEAKALDLALLAYESQQTHEWTGRYLASIEHDIAGVKKLIEKVLSKRD
eukprot:gnl/TRDRNA2_/TRDRNA2_139674_c2_seq1.p1 gnl/TRDRNA2_/TRDRNA2_139674_c2~~gnl/TRDRNA2_/TRDRNA2_139674_c2_seq1.p1  ORF type:complete len:246 (+),score=49.37 gnl/TRDRNA2_/TRDRNA2_139674_c2_seq1:1-738(+)